MNILLKNIFIVSPLDNLYGNYDLYIENGIIQYLDIPGLKIFRDINIIDCTNLHCFPGLFDMHVHFRDPGQLHKEDIYSGAESAANGGFTGVLCMPNTNPPIDNKDILNILQKKSNQNIVDIYFSVCATKERKGKEIYDYSSLINEGAKAITDDGNPIEDNLLMFNSLKLSSKLSVPVLQHAENYKISGDGVINEGKVSSKLGLRGIPKSSEITTVKRDLELCGTIDSSYYHVQHVSCGETISLIRDAKYKGRNVTSEVCPHHFILTEDYLVTHKSNAKMNPPLREMNDILKILEGLKDNTIDVICTDHAPHSNEEKNKGIEKAPFGIIGLESCFALTFTYLVKNEIINLSDLVYKLCINPRKILNINVPLIKIGEKANISIFNINSEWIIDVNKFKSKSRNSPFNEWHVQGKPFGVINNNQFRLSDL